MWITFTLEEFHQLYICEIFRSHGVLVSIVLDRDPGFTAQFPKSHEDTVDDEHSILSLDIWSVKEDHTDFRGHAACMCPGSKG